jgi:chloramphenicol-sensitive protein RarD
VPSEPRSHEATGVLFGLAAYSLWGFAPAYWKVLHALDPVEVLVHRILWAFVVAMGLLALTGGFGAFRTALRTRAHVMPVLLASMLLAINWLVFIFAVANEQVLATSLGYYLNPLINVVLGLFVLGERMRPLQWLAVAIAAFGVGQYVYVLGQLPWISVVLALSFALYGLVRKTAPVEPIAGFGVETTLMAVPALGYALWLSSAARAAIPVGSFGMDAFIAASGLVTAAPLVLFNAAARRLPLVTIGILQYIAPSLALVLAVVAYGEPFEPVHAWTFGCVWLALALFTAEAWLANRRVEEISPSR